MKCRGEGCPKRERCERFTSDEKPVQSWWSVAPYDRVTGDCRHFCEVVEEEVPDTPWYSKPDAQPDDSSNEDSEADA